MRYLILAALIGAMGCGADDPDHWPREKFAAAILQSSDSLGPACTEALNSKYDWSHTWFTESSLFGLPVERDHKIYVVRISGTSPPLELLVAASRTSGEALVLTSSSQNYSALLRVEGIRPGSVGEAQRLALEYLRLTESPLPEWRLIQSEDDMPYAEASALGVHLPSPQKVASIVGAPETVEVAPGSYKTVCFVLHDVALVKTTVRVDAKGDWIHLDEVVAVAKPSE